MIGYCIGFTERRPLTKLTIDNNHQQSTMRMIEMRWGITQDCQNTRSKGIISRIYPPTTRTSRNQNASFRVKYTFCTFDSEEKSDVIHSTYTTEPITGRQWRISDQKAKWDQAEDICNSEGGFLAKIDSYEIEQFIKFLLEKENQNIQFFIGMS